LSRSSLAYRWRLGFRAGPLLGLAIQRSAGSFWRSFFAEFFPRTPIRAAASPSGHDADHRAGGRVAALGATGSP